MDSFSEARQYIIEYIEGSGANPNDFDADSITEALRRDGGAVWDFEELGTATVWNAIDEHAR